ncbi:Fc.00g092640.m01.CDS01 [Cosmosporella sp. VM-42]
MASSSSSSSSPTPSSTSPPSALAPCSRQLLFSGTVLAVFPSPARAPSATKGYNVQSSGPSTTSSAAVQFTGHSDHEFNFSCPAPSSPTNNNSGPISVYPFSGGADSATPSSFSFQQDPSMPSGALPDKSVDPKEIEKKCKAIFSAN